jgi:DNA-binding PadR family transcriptional regulator
MRPWRDRSRCMRHLWHANQFLLLTEGIILAIIGSNTTYSHTIYFMDIHMDKNNTPLTEATYFILLSLSQEPRHGYAIIKDVEELSCGRIKFSTGTLYGAIKRLLQEGWIERVPNKNQPYPNRERKEYTLTEKGRKVFMAELARLRALVSASKLHTSGEKV